MTGSYRGIIFRLTHNFCALHFVQVPQLCGHLAVIAGQRQTKGLQHKAGVPFPSSSPDRLQPPPAPAESDAGRVFPRPFRAQPDAVHNFRAGGEFRQKLAAPRRVNGPPHDNRELRADADIQHQQSQQRQHGQPGCDGLFPVPFERLQEFFAGRYFLPQATAYSARVDAPRRHHRQAAQQPHHVSCDLSQTTQTTEYESVSHTELVHPPNKNPDHPIPHTPSLKLVRAIPER